MPRTLKEICNLSGCEDLTIVAGENGLSREIQWTTVIDSIDLIAFSNAGDLNFVTGLGLHAEEDILALTRESFRYRMAGIVFAPGGPYFDAIPQSVLAFGDKHHFPVFSIPWESKISDFTRIIGRFIVNEAYPSRSVNDILKSIVTGKEPFPYETNVTEQLHVQGINKYDAYRVGLLQIVKNPGWEEPQWKSLYGDMVKQLNNACRTGAYVLPLSFGAAVLFLGAEADEIVSPAKLEHLTDIAGELQEAYEHFEIRLGLGNLYRRVEQISSSYDEAALVVNLLKAKTQSEKAIYEYEKMGAYRVIWEAKNQKTAIKFSERTLGALEVHDSVNDTDLMMCLRAYLEYNCSVKETSEKLYLHKNTVLYKLRKIETILDCSLSNQRELFEIQLALMIKDIYELTL